MIAEKFQAVVHLGTANTRMKDFYDLYVLSETLAFVQVELAAAVRATFLRRGTTMPDAPPPGLTDDFATDEKRKQWKGFLDRSRIVDCPVLPTILERLRVFLAPVTWRGASAKAGRSEWAAGGPWSAETSTKT